MLSWLVFTTIVVILLLLLFLVSDCLVLVLLLVVLVVVVVVALTAFGTFLFFVSFMAMGNGKGYIICCFRRFDYLAEQIKYIDESFF